jgi:hypothetical protein
MRQALFTSQEKHIEEVKPEESFSSNIAGISGLSFPQAKERGIVAFRSNYLRIENKLETQKSRERLLAQRVFKLGLLFNELISYMFLAYYS